MTWTARRVAPTASGDGGRCGGIFPHKEIADNLVHDIGVIQEIEKVARDGLRCLRKVGEPVDRFGEFGCAARPMPQLSRDEFRVGRTRAYDPRQRSR